MLRAHLDDVVPHKGDAGGPEIRSKPACTVTPSIHVTGIAAEYATHAWSGNSIRASDGLSVSAYAGGDSLQACSANCCQRCCCKAKANRAASRRCYAGPSPAALAAVITGSKAC